MQADAFEFVLKLMRSGASNTPLLRLLHLVQIVAGSSAAALFVSRNGEQEVVLGRGMPYSFFKSPMPAHPPVSEIFDRPSIVEDADEHPLLGRRPFDRMRDHWRWIAGVPLDMPQLPYKLTLLALDGTAGGVRKADLLDRLALLAGVASDELQLISDLASHRESAGNLMMEADCVRDAVDHSTLPMVLIDHDLAVKAISDPMARIMDTKAEERRGRPVGELLAHRDDELLAFLERRLRSKGGEQTFQLPRTEQHPALELSALHCTEVGTGDDTIFVTAQPPKLDRVREDGDNRWVGFDSPGERASVTCDFLLSTLIPAQRLRRRGRTDYHTLMRWRSAIKESQIAALRALKRDPPATLVDRVAQEIATAATSLFGRDTARAVAAVPCGHSGPGCLSERVGRAVAERMGAPFRKPFEPLLGRGSSHPKSNTRRAPIRLVQRVDEPVLLVDDVATSGVHLDQAARALRAHAPAVFPLVWIAD